MIFEKGILFKTKEEYDSELILCPIKDYSRDKYINLRIIMRTIISIPLAYVIGYMLIYYSNTLSEVKIYALSIILTFPIAFYLLQIPHEFLHCLLYPNAINSDETIIYYFNRKRLLTSYCSKKTTKGRLSVVILLPCFIITLITGILLFTNGYNPILFSLFSANLILSSEDILNLLLLCSNNAKGKLYIIPNSYDYLNKKNHISESEQIELIDNSTFEN